MEKQKNDWMPIHHDARLPSDHLIVEWKHPDYGTIKGSIIGGEDKSLWVLPADGVSPEIWLGEFTGYRKIIKP